MKKFLKIKDAKSYVELAKNVFPFPMPFDNMFFELIKKRSNGDLDIWLGGTNKKNENNISKSDLKIITIVKKYAKDFVEVNPKDMKESKVRKNLIKTKLNNLIIRVLKEELNK